jgi:hypothetical protein
MTAYSTAGKIMAEKDEALIKREHAAWVATGLTLAGGLLAYLISVGAQLDDRIDRLEEDSKVLIGDDGKIAPARESLEAYYGVKALEARIVHLESLMHNR